MAYPFPLRDQMTLYPLAGDGVTVQSSAQAEVALRGMRGSLKRWLKVRRTMDAYVAGLRKPAGFLGNPGARPLPPVVAGLNLRRDRLAGEQDLADTIFALLRESGFDPASLPSSNVAVDPNAAVKLAELAIAGRAPTEASSPSAQGFIWLIAIPVAGAVLIISQLISSKAKLLELKENNRCIESRACTDTGFWLKLASVGVIAWLAWDKLGLREAAASARRRITEKTK